MAGRPTIAGRVAVALAAALAVAVATHLAGRLTSVELVFTPPEYLPSRGGSW